MRIAIDYTPAIAQSAGIGRYTRSLVGALARLESGDEYLLLSADAPTAAQPFPIAASFQSQVIRLAGRTIGSRRLTILWHRLRIPAPVEMLTGRVDVFHGPDFALPPALAVPRVVTIHDLAFLTHPQFATPSLARYLAAVVPRSLHRADAIIAVSETTAAAIMARYGVARERISVITPGVDASFAPVTDRQTLATIDVRYRLEHPLALAVGTIEPRKRYDYLIAAFAQARQQPGGPRMLAIAGRWGWLYERVFRAVEEQRIGDVVRFLDYVPEDDLAALYSTADVLAMPSAYEGFGIPVIEAMACGTPVVCSDGGALPEAAGEAALIVPVDDIASLADALVAVTSETSRQEAMRARGLARAAECTWERVARRHLEVYHEVYHRVGRNRKHGHEER
ncbi:MAG TPA: glycosyltransferase family 1 protein [Ktedonobacterales bacterium]|nr:glycosyltransferase family 1 protein [Ktedonobacterales bacterium]